MASCFRTVPSRLCCSSYLKSSPMVHLDMNNPCSSKITSNECSKQNNCFQIATINNISTYKDNFPNNQSLIHQNIVTPLSSSNLTSQDIIMWYRRESGLLRTCPPISSESFKNTLLLAESTKSQNTEEPKDCGRPSNEHLEKVFLTLSEDLPRLFVKPMNYGIFNRDVILENNIRGTRSVGITSYVSQIALLKAVGHFKFAHVKFVILKITKHPEEGTVKCRWRIQGISALRAIATFFTSKTGTTLQKISEPPIWYDGFSIYYLNSEGEIYKHVIDKMQPDDDKIVDEKPGITKLAMFLGLGLAPREEQALFMNIVEDYFKDSSCLSQVMLPLNKIE
ncbi:uncharacterized protein LOC135831721 [Planococcus citri]|uniref:uncharacterized protein LOC135831721 n=1 Tax=Planococcus citri TaxID=170843 RepID=UPI0031F9EE77